MVNQCIDQCGASSMADKDVFENIRDLRTRDVDLSFKDMKVAYEVLDLVYTLIEPLLTEAQKLKARNNQVVRSGYVSAIEQFLNEPNTSIIEGVLDLLTLKKGSDSDSDQ